MTSAPITAGEFRSLLSRVVFLPALVLGIFAGALAFQNAQLRKSAALVDHSDITIAHLNELMRLMIDEETGVRGYLLDRDKSFLQPYQAAQQTIPEEFRALEELLAGDPPQLGRLRALESAHAEWLEFTSSRLDTSASPVDLDRAALEGKTRMDALRRDATQMLQSEAALRDERAHRAEQSNLITFVILAVLTVLGAGSLALYTRATVLRLSARYRAMYEELENSERQFRELAESIPQLAWIAQPDGRIFWFNRRWYDYTGTTSELMTGWGWRSVHDSKRLDEIEGEWRNSIATGQPFDKVLPLRGADGIFRPFLTRVMPVTDNEGRVLRWVGTNTDISAERAAAEALRNSEETLRVSLEASNTGTFRWDAESGRFLEVGANLRRLFGFHDEQRFTSTEDLLRVVHPEDAPKVSATAGRARTTDQFDVEFRVIHPDGSTHWLYDRAKLLTGPGRIFVGACTDVTQHKLAEDTLRRTEKLAIVGRMASSISHEINNPLAAITNLMYLIQCADSLDDVRAFAATAEKELSRVSQIVTQTLRFHRAASRPTRFNAGLMLDSAISLFEPHLATSGIAVEKSLDPDATIFGNDGELRQVLLNLIGNAIDATRGIGSRILVRERIRTDARTGARGVRITIADDGHGMPESIAKRIFEPFFSTKGESGTGLGLWISEEIIRKHGGTIQVRSSQAPQAHGTVFTVFLPFAKPESVSDTYEPTAIATGPGKTKGAMS